MRNLLVVPVVQKQRVEISFHEVFESFRQEFENSLKESSRRSAKAPFVFFVVDAGFWSNWRDKFHQFLDRLVENIDSLNFHVEVFPSGEENKNLKNLELLWDKALSIPVPRNTLVVALGGGVVGDVAGFFASTLYRGVELWQVPTTVLAQVDASFGGKTGIDTPYGKNLIGTFYNASRVIIVREFLDTLPQEELLNGTAELIKSAVIGDGKLFREVERALEKGVKPWERVDFLKRALMVKVRVVSADPFEKKKIRYFLNLGHTLGHALEAYAGYSLKHGYAVSVGMVFAACLSVRLGMTSPEFFERLKSILRSTGLPVSVRELFKRFSERSKPAGAPAELNLKAPESFDALVPYLLRDKKREADQINWVLPVKPGKVVIEKGIPLSLLENCYGEVF